jgi:hypothetical protein
MGKAKNQREQSVALNWLYTLSAYPPFLTIVSAFVIVVIFAIGSSQIPKSSDVKFSLRNIEEINLKQKLDPYFNFPPTCGCLHPKYGQWSGVSLATREIKIKSDQNKTSFHISASRPGSLIESFMGNKISIKEYDIDRVFSDEVPFYFKSKSEIYIPKYSYKYIENNNTHGGEYFFNKNMNLFLSNDYPVLSYNGSTRSDITVKRHMDPVTHEHFSMMSDRFRNSIASRAFLGSTGVNFDGGHLDIASNIIYVWFENVDHPTRTTLWQIESPYSIKFMFRIYDFEKKPNTLHFSFKELDAEDYNLLKDLRSKSPFVDAIFESEGQRVIDEITQKQVSSIPKGDKYIMQMRQPDLPPRFGLNLYGDYAFFNLKGASGSLSIGSEAYSLANNEVTFDGRISTTKMSIRETLPIYFENSNYYSESVSNFSGIGNIKIEGDTIDSFFNLLFSALTWWGIVAMIVAIITFFGGIFRWHRRIKATSFDG